MRYIVVSLSCLVLGACAAHQSVAPAPNLGDAAAAPPPAQHLPSQAELDAARERQALNASSALGSDVSNEQAPSFEPLYFAFDSTDIGAESQKTLAEIAEYMTKNKDLSITVAGHCDQRGTPEYNLALGERRAHAARTYLQRLGIPADRVKVVSYGSEHPALAGDGEAVWSKNRRDEFKVAIGKLGNPSATR